MGLNVNYSLLMEGNNIYHKNPVYSKYRTVDLKLFTEEYLMQLSSNFNQEIREANQMISVFSDDTIYEGTILLKIGEVLRNSAEKVKKAIIMVWNKILEFLRKIRDRIKEVAASFKDKIETKYRYHERMKLLRNALNSASDDEKIISISDINPTNELLSRDFPDISVLGDSLITATTDAMNNYCLNIVSKSGKTEILKNTELKASESFMNYIEGEKEGLLAKIFGKYQYDSTAITRSAMDAAEKAFGSDETKDTTLTVDLYSQACDNIERSNEILRYIDSFEKEVNQNFNKVKSEMETICHSYEYLEKELNPKYDIDLNATYHETAKVVLSRVNRIYNIIQQVVNANFILASKKIARINRIFSPIGDSAKVKRACHRIIAKYIEISDDTQQDQVVSGISSTNELYEDLDNYNAYNVMLNEALLESEYSEQLLQAINEGDQPEASAKTEENNKGSVQQQQQSEEPKQNVVKKTGKAILDWLKNLIAKLGEMMGKFKNKTNDIFAVNAPQKVFWNNRKDRIKQNPITDTMVNDWYCYNIDAFANSTYIGFDINDDRLKDDKTLQDAIIHQIMPNGNLPNFEENESFAQKVTKIYQGEHINDEKGNGRKLNEIGYDHNKVWSFIDEFLNKGYNSIYLGKITKDYDQINNDYKEATGKFDELKERLAQSNKSSTAPKTQEAGQGEANQQNNTEQQSAKQGTSESAIELDDFNFNLADHFGLVHNEATFTVGQNDASLNTNVNADGPDETDKILGDMIKRSFNCNTSAITAKMTNVIAAYRQYFALIRNVYGINKAPQQNDNQVTTKQID